MTPPKIMIALPVGSGSLPWATVLSLMQTLDACRAAEVPCRIEAVVGCSVVTWARSALADAFLKAKDFTHIFWVDSDIVFTPNDFFRLVGLGAVHDVVGATYPFKKLEPMAFLINHDGEPGQYTVNGHGCVKIKGMGLGFTLMKRAVVEKVAATKTKRRDPMTGLEYADIFRIDHEGEDLAFFTDIRKAGYDVWLDPSIQLGHVGQMIFRGDPLEAMGLTGYTKEIPA